MKKQFIRVLFAAAFLVTGMQVAAQDSVKTGITPQTNSGNEKADNLRGKKIQQQSLSNHSFEKLDTTVPRKPVNKSGKKSKRKHS